MDEKLNEGPSSQENQQIWLEISKKRGSSINPYIHHSKVPSYDFFKIRSLMEKTWGVG